MKGFFDLCTTNLVVENYILSSAKLQTSHNRFDRITYVEQDLGRKTLYQRVAVLINSPGTSENPIAVDMVYKWKHSVDMTTEFEAFNDMIKGLEKSNFWEKEEKLLEFSKTLSDLHENQHQAQIKKTGEKAIRQKTKKVNEMYMISFENCDSAKVWLSRSGLRINTDTSFWKDGYQTGKYDNPNISNKYKTNNLYL